MQVRFVWIGAILALLLFATGACGRAQDLTSCTSSIRVLINQYSNERIPTGTTLWFSGVLESVQSANGDLGTTPLQIDVRQAQITFGKWPYTVTLPDSTILIDPSATQPQRWWMDRSAWSVSFAPSALPEAFFDGAPYAAPEPFIPGDSGPITWTATFAASRPGITLTWAWSVAAYSQFGPNGRLLVKPLKAPVGQPQPALYQNDDPAGTPELYKQYAVAGAMGDGAPNYTGARSEPATVHACASNQRAPRVVLIHRPPIRGAQAFAADRCYTGDVCASIRYADGDRLAIYSEGTVTCDRYALYFVRTKGDRTVFAFSRSIASLCGGASARLTLDAGRTRLTISRNADGSLKFRSLF